MMQLELLRFSSGVHDTLGMLFEVTPRERSPDLQVRRRFLCYTLEDEAREVKMPTETRIKAGTYSIDLRRAGGLHQKYAVRFSTIHHGMLWLQQVPYFEWIYLHIGNDEGDTDGCPLMGDQVVQNVTGKGKLIGSEAAYRRVYPQIAAAILSGAGASITVVDYA